MELRTLQYFLAVVREENLSRAAEVLHVTQPTLSRQMAQLEEELGAPLSSLDIFATYNIITNVAMLVDSGVASALTIEGAVDLFGSDRLVFRPLYPELSMSSVLAWKKFQPNFGAAGRFIEYLKSMH